jgi:RNA ligase (TIGR02306 family)
MRKLATIRRIDDVRPITGADAIECAVIGGWTVVIKKGQFAVGDLAVYLEIDSFVPTELAPFLTKPGHFPKEYNGAKGERLRTVKLRGTTSQGLLLPVTVGIGGFTWIRDINNELILVNEGDDVTDCLGIQKWEAPVPAQLAGQVRGNFPTVIPKTNLERVQNLVKEIAIATESGLLFDIEEKIEGTSSTFFLDNDGDFQVCSRNLSLKNDGENTYWKVAKELDIQKKMQNHNLYGFAIQGEIVGPGIQANYYGVPTFRLYVFDVYNANTGKYLNPSNRRNLIDGMGLTNVPLIAQEQTLLSVDNILAYADGKSVLSNKKREGVVYKQSSGGMAFKAVSNQYLIQLPDDTKSSGLPTPMTSR